MCVCMGLFFFLFLWRIGMHRVKQLLFIFYLAGQSWVLLLSSLSRFSFSFAHVERIGRPLDMLPSCNTILGPICLEHYCEVACRTLGAGIHICGSWGTDMFYM